MDASQSLSDARGRRPSRRPWLPLVTVVLALALIGLIWSPILNHVDRGLRIYFNNVVAAIGAAMLLGWYAFLSGLSRRARFIGLALLVLLVLAISLSIRRVEFTGSMKPTFIFRWAPDRLEELEAHRARQQSARDESAGSASPTISPTPHDVYEFRGPQRSGVFDSVTLARDWVSQPPKLIWRQPVGGGYAAFVVAGSLAITIEQRRDQEAVVAYDFDTGKERWKHQYAALFSETLGGDGPRATPTIHEGRVYSLGATGVLACLDLATGGKHWAVNVLEDNGVSNLDWGMAGSPLIVGAVVIVNPGNQKGGAESFALIAYDRATGKRMWGAGHSKAGYASPILADLAGRSQLVLFDGQGVAGFDLAFPQERWRIPWQSQFDINASQPVPVGGDRVFITSTSGAEMIQVASQGEKFAAESVWKNNKLRCYFGTPIFYEGNLYGIDDTLLACVDAATGRQRWKARAGAYGHGQLLRSGELLLVLSETGVLALVEVNPDKFHEVARIQAIEGKTWNYPTLAGNRILVRNHLEMASYDLPTE